jgi:hypothetical protein
MKAINASAALVEARHERCSRGGLLGEVYHDGDGEDDARAADAPVGRHAGAATGSSSLSWLPPHGARDGTPALRPLRVRRNRPTPGRPDGHRPEGRLGDWLRCS